MGDAEARPLEPSGPIGASRRVPRQSGARAPRKASSDEADVLSVGETALSAIGQIAIRALDTPRAIAFYRDVLRLPLLFEAPPLAFFAAGGTRLMLGPAEPPFDHPSSILYFTVADVHEAHRDLVTRGAVFDGAPHVVHRTDRYELWIGVFRDSEGNPLAIMEERHLR
jgi:methylmalonyl-CoA/ethylmalonyl-CoA epimerase